MPFSSPVDAPGSPPVAWCRLALRKRRSARHMITECPLRSRPHRTREMLSEGWGAMSLPQGLRTKGTELAAPGRWVHSSKFGSKGSAGKGRLEEQGSGRLPGGGSPKHILERCPKTAREELPRAWFTGSATGRQGMRTWGMRTSERQE